MNSFSLPKLSRTRLLLADMVEPESTVFVVDDDPSICRSIERLIGPSGFKVQSFRSAAQFLAQGRPPGPACLILDVQLPGLSGLDLQRELTNAGIQLPIIFITGHGDIPMTVRAMKGGAVEFLTKPFRGGQLLSAIRAALERDRTMLQQRIQVAQLHNRYDLLTPREREVLALLVRGLLNKQVAGELATTERTIKFHRANIMRKMQAESVADLVKMAQKLGLGG
jgi:FixJ family two-component response regulator